MNFFFAACSQPCEKWPDIMQPNVTFLISKNISFLNVVFCSKYDVMYTMYVEVALKNVKMVRISFIVWYFAEFEPNTTI